MVQLTRRHEKDLKPDVKVFNHQVGLARFSEKPRQHPHKILQLSGRWFWCNTSMMTGFLCQRRFNSDAQCIISVLANRIRSGTKRKSRIWSTTTQDWAVPLKLWKEGNDRNDRETLQLEGTDSTNIYQQLGHEVQEKSEGFSNTGLDRQQFLEIN